MQNRIRMVEICDRDGHVVVGRELNSFEVNDDQLEVVVQALSSDLREGTGIEVNGTLWLHKPAPEPVTSPAATDRASAPSDNVMLEILKHTAEMAKAMSDQAKANIEASRTNFAHQCQLTQQSFENHSRVVEVLNATNKREERIVRIQQRLLCRQLEAESRTPTPPPPKARLIEQIIEILPAAIKTGRDLAAILQDSKSGAKSASGQDESDPPPTRLDLGWPNTAAKA